MVLRLKVLQIVRIALDWVCSKQNIGQFVSNLIEINFHARIDARLDETSSIRKCQKSPLFFRVRGVDFVGRKCVKSGCQETLVF
jgi:hypothetical protein